MLLFVFFCFMANDIVPPPEVTAALAVLTDYLHKSPSAVETVVTPHNYALLRMYDGSLQAHMRDGPSRAVSVLNREQLGVTIEVVASNITSRALAPEEAVYCVRPFQGGENGGVLSGDLPVVYVGSKGILLGDTNLRLVKKLLNR